MLRIRPLRLWGISWSFCWIESIKNASFCLDCFIYINSLIIIFCFILNLINIRFSESSSLDLWWILNYWLKIKKWSFRPLYFLRSLEIILIILKSFLFRPKHFWSHLIQGFLLSKHCLLFLRLPNRPFECFGLDPGLLVINI